MNIQQAIICTGVLSLTFLFSVGLACGAVDEPPQEGERFNVLFITIDDLRCNLGCMGDTLAKTPNFDALAKRGTLFSRAYVSMAICNASRAAVITGKRNDNLRVWDLHQHFRNVNPKIVTLPQYFKQNGFKTVSIGKILHGTGKPSSDPVSWTVPERFNTKKHRYANQKLRAEHQGRKGPAVEVVRTTETPDDVLMDHQVATAACEQLVEFSRTGEPFFLAVGFRKPHLPFVAPERFFDLYQREQFTDENWKKSYPALDFPAGAPEIAGHRSPEFRGYKDVPAKGPLAPELRAKLRHGYYAATSFVDQQLGRLLKTLDETGLAKKTVVCLYSDHGYELGDHSLWGKLTNYEIDTRVPLFFVVPGVTGGKETDAIVETIDIYPTLVALAGLPRRERLDGMSLDASIRTKKFSGKPAVLSQFHRPVSYNLGNKAPRVVGYAVRTDRYRAVFWLDFKTRSQIAVELYDHQSDPAEQVNVASKPENAAVLKSHRRLLNATLNPNN